MFSKRTLIISTTILSVLILVTVFFNSCLPAFADENQIKAENAMYGWSYLDGKGNGNNYTRYRNVNIDGHTYIVFTNRLGYSGGISVIHSESCPCRKKK